MSKKDTIQNTIIKLYKSTDLYNIDDVLYALRQKGLRGSINLSGHKVRNGEEYIELRNISFIANKDFIIDAPEYPELVSQQWYVDNYEPKITWQIPKVLDILAKNPDSRHAIISFYCPDDELDKDDMICTMYISLRLDELPENCAVLTYTVHMRSSDIREYRSDIRFHKRVRHSLALALSELLKRPVIEGNIIWYADSLQCWDKDWKYLGNSI